MNSKDYHKNDRAEGWGWISSSASTLIAWSIIAALGHEPTIGLVFGSMGMGFWKVWRGSRRG